MCSASGAGRVPQADGVDDVVYVLWDGERRLLKIGTSSSPGRRRAALEAALGRPLALVAAWPGGRAEERALHRRFAGHAVGHEWFRPHAALNSWLGVDPDTIPGAGGRLAGIRP
ncbi:MAG: GIY-YIG nuclease family protein [Planctomycetaceae bacterium]|nr:GIY-YIG nuclease family protein [Planctomycetaceae bacterium]MBV8607588.1 GIY-YIG nuclease family protein [Singulisphaera sp.]MBV8233272.1 GIY-YIG nuclease family protein [Planctomycetaceae bacterium]MBV8266074.1 GIY-YIG nuclease family protein [Planctomycetaceae bacterium]MBV8315492.1 GIY-YIG nuclease family protein [Planctomycetaceae bacterium]